MILNSKQQNTKPIERAIYLNGDITIGTEPYSTFTVASKKNERVNALPMTTSFQQFILENESEKKVMTKNEIDELRNSVLRTNRPLNPWFEAQKPFTNRLSPSTSNDTKQPATNSTNKAFDHSSPSTSQPITHLRKKGSPVRNQQNVLNLKELNKSMQNPALLYEAKVVKEKQQQQIKQQESYSDYDISRALASDIKMLEQLEVEHQQRSNRIMAKDPKYKNSICNLKKNNAESDNQHRQQQILIEDDKHYSGNSDYSSRSGTSSSFATMSSPSSSPNNLCYSSDEKKLENDKKLEKTKFKNEHTIEKKQNHLKPEQYYKKQDTKNFQQYFNNQKFDNNNNVELMKNSNTSKNDNISDDNLSDMKTYSIPTCFACDKKISDVILQALGGSYHPKCFCCTKCHCCLDGVPFAVDNNGKVFCMKDYENIFIPACVACQKPISAINNFGQIIRVVFQEKEYHIECFNCEGCGLQLSNEEKNKCYPISSHLLCRQCHFQWKRLGGVEQPITDL